MSDAINNLPGSFPRTTINGIGPPPFQVVFGDQWNCDSITRHTDGSMIGIPIQGGPAQNEIWNIVGLNYKAAIGYLDVLGHARHYGKLGDLWLGIVVDSPLVGIGNNPTAFGGNPPAAFPVDLSNFTKIWEGATDDIVAISLDVTSTFYKFHEIMGNFVLPFPLTVRPGAQLGMVAILTSSTVMAIPAGAFETAIAIQHIDFSIIYTRG